MSPLDWLPIRAPAPHKVVYASQNLATDVERAASMACWAFISSLGSRDNAIGLAPDLSQAGMLDWQVLHLGIF
ncbi:MAG: hypothetical protein H7A42_04315 [Chlamydiales bacterium]|nr:hypothetical protein [Chlamydiales bacterium]